MLGDLQEIDARLEPAASCQRRRDVVEPRLMDLVDDDRAAGEAVTAADFDVRALPDAHRAADLAVDDALVKPPLKKHLRVRAALRE